MSAKFIGDLAFIIVVYVLLIVSSVGCSWVLAGQKAGILDHTYHLL